MPFIHTDHFDIVDRGGVKKRVCSCKQVGCHSSYSFSSTGGTLSKHYKVSHPKVWATLHPVLVLAIVAPAVAHNGHEGMDIEDDTRSYPAAAAAPAASVSSGSQKRYRSPDSIRSPPKRTNTVASATQPTLQTAFTALNNTSLAQKVALFFATNHIAYNIADSSSFRELVVAIRSTTTAVPHRTALKEAVGSLADITRTAVVQRITGGTAPVTIAIDGWTNVRHVKITNVMLLCSGVVQQEMFVKMNYRALINREQHYQLRPSLIELLPDGDYSLDDLNGLEEDASTDDDEPQSESFAAAA